MPQNRIKSQHTKPIIILPPDPMIQLGKQIKQLERQELENCLWFLLYTISFLSDESLVDFEHIVDHLTFNNLETSEIYNDGLNIYLNKIGVNPENN